MMVVTLLFLVAVIIRSNREYEAKLDLELRTERDRYVRLSRFDALSGLANRGDLQTGFDAATASREAGVLDVDRFKQVNDRFGHVAGDRVIIGVAEAEDLRRRINALGFSLPDGSDFNVTASIGIDVNTCIHYHAAPRPALVRPEPPRQTARKARLSFLFPHAGDQAGDEAGHWSSNQANVCSGLRRTISGGRARACIDTGDHERALGRHLDTHGADLVPRPPADAGGTSPQGQVDAQGGVAFGTR
jgi:hypothetical protein